MLILSESTMTEPESTLTESGSKIRYYITKSITSQCALIMAHNVGSYTQGRTAGDFLSGRTRKSSGEPPPEHPPPPDLPGS